MNGKIVLRFILISSLLFSVFSCKNDDDNVAEVLPARFELPFNNTNVQRGKLVQIQVAISDPQKVKNLKIYNKDTVIFDGKITTKEKSFTAATNGWSIGTNQLTLSVTSTTGKNYTYHRIVKILPDVFPKVFKTEAIKVYPHNTSSYTQGLEFDGDQMYEGTGGRGDVGHSLIAKVDYKTGKFTQEHKIPAKYFGEGITMMGDTLYQLTWQKHTCFIYNKHSFKQLGTFTYTGEGWGLCNDGKELIMSDGSNRIYFRDPRTFQILRTIEVYNNEGPVDRLNELEYIHGKIYANVYTTNRIVVIDPKTGIVVRRIDASLLALDYKKTGEVLNGIAYKKDTKQLFVTGKDWPSLIEIALVPE